MILEVMTRYLPGIPEVIRVADRIRDLLGILGATRVADRIRDRLILEVIRAADRIHDHLEIPEVDRAADHIRQAEGPTLTLGVIREVTAIGRPRHRLRVLEAPIPHKDLDHDHLVVLKVTIPKN